MMRKITEEEQMMLDALRRGTKVMNDGIDLIKSQNETLRQVTSIVDQQYWMLMISGAMILWQSIFIFYKLIFPSLPWYWALN